MQKYLSLPEDEKDKIRQLVYILNRFSVSMEAYHEVNAVNYVLYNLLK